MSQTIIKAKVVILLEKVLADSYSLMIKTHNYHWNITGPNFYSLHKLFQEQYDELFEAIDEIAERIRALGEKAPGSLSEFSQLTSISEADKELSSEAMIKDLEKSNQTIIKTFQELRDLSGQDGDPETEDMAISRIQVHQKNAWMLNSSIL